MADDAQPGCAVGDRIRLDFMGRDPDPVPVGTLGTVTKVPEKYDWGTSGSGQIAVRWDNGRTLALVIGVDRFTVMPPMIVEYSVIGTLELPYGSRMAKDRANTVVLPGGQIISVHPIIELASSLDADDHRNLNYNESETFDVRWGDYDRTLDEIPGGD